MSLIETLTPEQEALIPVYCEKWKAIALSTERIDRQQASEAIKAAYTLIDRQKPEIVFCDSPYAALKTIILSQLQNQLGTELVLQLLNRLVKELGNQLLQSQLSRELRSQLFPQLQRQLQIELANQVRRQLGHQLRHQLQYQIGSQLDRQLKSQIMGILLRNCVHFSTWLCYASVFDFCISVLNYTHDQETWTVLQSLAKSFYFDCPFEKTCLVCDRPIILSFDNEQRFHAEREPAIQFADGYSLYFYHGVTLPEKYGKVHPDQWQAKWLLEERNAEQRRLLIQKIGYAQICQDLDAEELDNWQDYILLRIDNADVEPIYLLKMTCPSTGFIHVLRVPPTIQSAREAICWVNWGIAPEEFSVQT